MTLRIELEPYEKLLIASSILTNGNVRSSFVLDGTSPVLRFRDSISQASANTAARRIYYCVQQMYLEGNIKKYEGSYTELLKRLLAEKPEVLPETETATGFILSGDLYKALRQLSRIVKREASSISRAA